MSEAHDLIDELLAHSHVRIKEPDRIKETLLKIATGGAEKLQVISDFDQTLTKVHDNGRPCCTTFGIFNTIPQLPEGFSSATKKLYEYYHTFEVHPNMTVEEKTPYMVEWYEESEKLLVGADITPDHVLKHVHESEVCFRDGSHAIFHALKNTEVPVLVFSAGVGDVVKIALEKHDMMHSNVRIISNFLSWENDTGKLCGFGGELIHVFNKNQRAVAAHEEYFSLLAHRPNVILLGDNEGDAVMGHGVQDPEEMIKIGFLYHNSEERIHQFMDQFDIVLIDDQTMSIPTRLLKFIVGEHHFP